MSSSMCVCVSVSVRTPLLLPSLPSSLAFFHAVPSLALASHDHQSDGPLCALLFLSLKGEKRREAESGGRVRPWMDVLLMKAECHWVHKSIASEVMA